MSQGLSTPEDALPARSTPSADRSAVLVGSDDVTAAVAGALGDRAVDVTRYEDPIVALKRDDGGSTDCVVLSGSAPGAERFLDRIARQETVVVRLDPGDREAGVADLVVSPAEEPRRIATRILEALEERTVERQLARHDRLLRTVHDVTRRAVEAADVGEICTQTCDRLVESDCYEVAWITRRQDGASVVQATAGIEPTMVSGPREPTDRSGVTVTEHGGTRTATIALGTGDEQRGTLAVSTSHRIDAAEREVLEDLATVLGEQLADAQRVVPPTPGEYGFGSPEAARTAMEGVRNVDLPPAFAEIVDEYEATVGTRDRFLWQWLHTVFPLFELSCIDEDHLEAVRTAKLATSMLVVVLDDLGEDPERYETFQEAAAVPFEDRAPDRDRSDVEAEPVRFIEDVWTRIEETLAGAPCREAYADTFRFDLRQVVTAIEYAHHVNEYPEVGNLREAKAYGAHNMMMFPAADIDLAHAPTFDRSELGTLRSVIYDAQQMGRIGNWLSTWERELAEGDVHAGTVLQALADDAIDRADLEGVEEDPAVRERVVDAIHESDSEATLLEHWEDHYRRIHRRTGAVESVDLSAFLDGMVEVFRYHRASRGLK